jgi:prepilin-type N-terminal cleavage/methylation domain-containing protein
MTRRPRQPRRRSFTLVELLVVIGIIGILGALTTIAVKAIAEDARLASGRNTATAVLGHARAMAMKRNTIVIATFRAVLTGEDQSRVEAGLAEFSGQSYAVAGLFGPGSTSNPSGAGIVDRFVPIPGTAVRLLPADVNIAAPHYGSNIDERWLACSNLALTQVDNANDEVGGAVIGVMFDSNGGVITDNSRTDSNRVFVDFNGDGCQRQGGKSFDNGQADPDCDDDYPANGQDGEFYCDCDMGKVGTDCLQQYFCQRETDDEPYVSLAHYLAVFDEREARTLYVTSQWSVMGEGGENRIRDLSDYVNEYASRLHFNRATGVVMSTEDR